jgi:hypothetical protein
VKTESEHNVGAELNNIECLALAFSPRNTGSSKSAIKKPHQSHYKNLVRIVK